MLAEASNWADVASEALKHLGPALAALLLAAAAALRARANGKARDALRDAVDCEADQETRQRIKKTAVYKDASLAKLLESVDKDGD